MSEFVSVCACVYVLVLFLWCAAAACVGLFCGFPIQTRQTHKNPKSEQKIIDCWRACASVRVRVHMQNTNTNASILLYVIQTFIVSVCGWALSYRIGTKHKLSLFVGSSVLCCFCCCCCCAVWCRGALLCRGAHVNVVVVYVYQQLRAHIFNTVNTDCAPNDCRARSQRFMY